MPDSPFASRLRPAPTATKIIAAAEERLTDGRTHVTCLRYSRAREQLEAHLDTLGVRMLLEPGVAMLELERELEPFGALLRVAIGEDLLYALPSFIRLERSPRLPTPDVRAQLRLAEECRRFITSQGLVDDRHLCAVWEVDGALRQVRSAIRTR